MPGTEARLLKGDWIVEVLSVLAEVQTRSEGAGPCRSDLKGVPSPLAMRTASSSVMPFYLLFLPWSQLTLD